MAENSKIKEKQHWAGEDPMLENARRLTEVYFSDSEELELTDHQEWTEEGEGSNRKSYVLATKQQHARHDR